MLFQHTLGNVFAAWTLALSIFHATLDDPAIDVRKGFYLALGVQKRMQSFGSEEVTSDHSGRRVTQAFFLPSITCPQLFDLDLDLLDRSVLHADTSASHCCLKSGGSEISGTVWNQHRLKSA